MIKFQGGEIHIEYMHPDWIVYNWQGISCRAKDIPIGSNAYRQFKDGILTEFLGRRVE